MYQCFRYSTCVTRTGVESPTCALMRQASTRSSESVTGTTTWTAPPPLTGEYSRTQAWSLTDKLTC